MSDVALRILAALHREIERRGGNPADLKTYDELRARLWRGVVRLFNGGADANFISTFVRSIDEQLTEAWNQGADEVGVSPEDMTSDDVEFLQRIIENENKFIDGILGDIDQARADGITREEFDKRFSARVDLWANRYTETVNMARVRFGAKERLEWELGATENHCPICEKLAGIVAFADEWAQAEIFPQNPPNRILSTEINGKPGCSGWRCDCRLNPTKKRRTPRAIDRLTEIALMAGGL